jgi:hypothetical protein
MGGGAEPALLMVAADCGGRRGQPWVDAVVALLRDYVLARWQQNPYFGEGFGALWQMGVQMEEYMKAAQLGLGYERRRTTAIWMCSPKPVSSGFCF